MTRPQRLALCGRMVTPDASTDADAANSSLVGAEHERALHYCPALGPAAAVIGGGPAALGYSERRLATCLATFRRTAGRSTRADPPFLALLLGW